MSKYVLRMEFKNVITAHAIYNQIENSIISRDTMNEVEIEYPEMDSNDFTVTIKDNSLLTPCMSFLKMLIEDSEYENIYDYNMDMGIECPNESDAFMVANFIHNQLQGLEDYVNNKIILNFTGNMIRLFIDKDSDYYPFFLFVPETLLLHIDNEDNMYIENNKSNNNENYSLNDIRPNVCRE